MNQALHRFSVEGRVVVVTGASSGIGKHMATVLAHAGAGVVLVARRKDTIDSLADTLRRDIPTARVHTVCCDLNAVEDFDALAIELSAPFGAPNSLINAAGVNFREPADQISAQSWNQTINLNLTVPFFLSRALVNGMRGDGTIINIASLQSIRAFPDSMPYGASKGGVTQLTRAMAQAWSPEGVRANAIAPGFFPTELTQAVFDDDAKAAANARQTCIGRNGELEDLSGPTLFLCSAASSYMTGQVLYVDGGFTAK